METLISIALAVETVKILCITYTDERSAQGSSLEDMRLGIQNNVIGTNMSHFGSANKGDIAIVTATDERGKRVFMIGILGDALPSCDVWAAAGGELWKHNRVFTPITDIIQMETIKKEWQEMCTVYAVNPHNIFNTRLCGYGSKYREALARAFVTKLFPLTTIRT